MKAAVFFIITLIFSCVSLAQDTTANCFPQRDGQIYYEHVIQVDSLSKEKLYLKIKSWALSSFNSQKAALQADDKDVGLIAFKSHFNVVYHVPKMEKTNPGSYDITYNFIMKVYYKDNKAKIVISDVSAKYINNDFPILDYQKRTDVEYQDPMFKKKKYVDFINKCRIEARSNFQIAHATFTQTIDGLEIFLKSNATTEADF